MPKPVMKSLNFYDLKARKKFTSTNYVIKTKNKRRFAIAKAPSGIASWRIIGKA